MNHPDLARIAPLVALATLAGGLGAQTIVPFPADYSNVAEGPFNAPNLPFANGTGRAMLRTSGRGTKQNGDSVAAMHTLSMPQRCTRSGRKTSEPRLSTVAIS